ncbi:MAG: tetraacyldisaccharide 4'-kinase [Gammaproteobacteria bacterium]|nr:MAG: tetraacyldisaccharide 4'-kinase [Gammaproteobacteria bacterium]
MKQWLLKKWSSRNWLTILLLPVSLLYRFVILKKRSAFLTNPPIKHPIPIVIVGNIYVGGTGKTPIVVHIVNLLKKRGYNPAVISRGYGVKVDIPKEVGNGSSTKQVGDEPMLIYNNCNVPIVVGPDRNASVEYILQKCDCDIIISDDGLQHYALNRDIEIVVFDGQKGLGNGFLLPAGPLREPFDRINRADFTLINGNSSYLKGTSFFLEIEHAVNMVCGETVDLKQFSIKAGIGKVHAVAGIGNPERFFAQLEQFGLEVIRHEYDDHYPYSEHNLDFVDGYPVVMTEKDAVKCMKFAKDDWWMIPASVRFSGDFESQFLAKVKQVS